METKEKSISKESMEFYNQLEFKQKKIDITDNAMEALIFV